MNNKRQLIDDIRRYNTTVAPAFLVQFDDDALRQYLDHLQEAHRKHHAMAPLLRNDAKLRLVS